MPLAIKKCLGKWLGKQPGISLWKEGNYLYLLFQNTQHSENISSPGERIKPTNIMLCYL
jgi:hypothetical protein